MQVALMMFMYLKVLILSCVSTLYNVCILGYWTLSKGCQKATLSGRR